MKMTKQMVASGGLVPAGLGVPGIEGIDDRDRKRPNIVLVQENSKVFRKAGAQPGQFVNGATSKPIPSNEFVPVYMTKFYDVYTWSGDQKKWEFRAFDENDARLEGRRWRPIKDQNLKAEIIPVLAAVVLIEGKAYALAFKNLSGYPAGQKLLGFIADSYKEEGLEMYAKTYRLLSRESTNKSGQEFWAMEVEPASDSSDNDRALAAQIQASLAGKAHEVGGELDSEV
jgi:hypothetical protein